MKVVIIEGPDNVGKTTLLNRLSKVYNIYYIHCTGPKSTDYTSQTIEQWQQYINVLKDIHGISKLKNADRMVVILDRSWVGEYVYGCKYRNANDETVCQMIDTCYTMLNDMDNVVNTTILLTVDNPEFCVRNDDGLSLSQANKYDIADEIARFDNIFEHNPASMCNCHRIVVNDGMQFRSDDGPYKEISDIIMNM